MNFVADESIDGPIVAGLRQQGHNVVYVAEHSPSLPDDDVLKEANSRGAILLTSDKDFGELVFRQRRVHGGVVLIRLAGLGPTAKAALVCEATQHHVHEFTGAFTVMSAGNVRIRRFP